MPWPLKRRDSVPTYTYNHYNRPPRPQGQPVGGGAFVDSAPPAPSQSYASQGQRPVSGGVGGGGGQRVYVGQPVQASPAPSLPMDPTQKMRDVVKQLRQVINEQKSRVNELRRDARKSLNAGDKDSYDLYVDNMVHVRMFMRKIDKAITSVNLIGTNLKMNQCNAQISGALVDFLKLQGNEAKVDMDEITRNYFDNQMNLDHGLEAFLDNMKDLNDPEGVMEEERARERSKIEAEFGRAALTNAPERASVPLSEAQSAREKLMST